MILNGLDDFREMWAVDFEFRQPDGERPEPHCMVARELRSGHWLRFWSDELISRSRSPVPADPGALFVAYYASAELGCHLALNWPLPARILDLCVEFKCLTSGLPTPSGRGLLGAMIHYGLDGIGAAGKVSMRQLAMRGGPFTETERRDLLAYCQSDVDALADLLPRMLPSIDLPRALIRGRYMAAAARMEWAGSPIDVPAWSMLQRRWREIRRHLIEQVDQQFGVYEGETFKHADFAQYLARHGIPWPRLPSGALDLKDATFKMMAGRYPQLQPLRQLRRTLAELRLNRLAVGSDGRNRCLLSCFGTKTGRNAPSTARFIFGSPAWCRSLIKPEPDRAIAYLDYQQQEFAIAAALSGDGAMMEAYQSGDPYMAFAKQAGAVPMDATKRTHPEVREQFKVAALAVQYGMHDESLARALGQPTAYARDLLRLHRQTYPEFWSWVESAQDHAMLHGYLNTVLGWRVHIGKDVNPRSLLNFPMQGNGAEMLRLACCLLTERGIQVCAPVHDAVLIEAPLNQIDEVVAESQMIMAKAAKTVLSGFSLRTDATVIRHPDRYADPRGVDMWERMTSIAESLPDDEAGHEHTAFGEKDCRPRSAGPCASAPQSVR